ncbi:succinoglycan biosynthesis protein ExoM [Amylibacter marinus]|uniref:Succinoglycan biosynthesis protein ExoM n=1 Tax=Amylibacter marinus TaxID=1475483 RepID=A0ABQ5VWC5_9RHOB|nr:glycosyltransferase family A protein [Amylibacter marinus]GLQ35583.1 succinoglycan biosynthesis protein ExoM [Amylibacter marinus]
MKFEKVAFRGKSICIALCSHGRREMLLRLLRSIADLYVEDYYTVSVLVVENEVEPKLEAELKALDFPFPLHYTHEPNLGLVNARNRIFTELEKMDVDWMCGVDDDEVLHPDWLVRYEQAVTELPDCMAFIGAVSCNYGPDFSKYVPHRITSNRKLGAAPEFYTTGNYMIHRKLYHSDDIGHRFDPRFNTSGGEDTAFFVWIEKQNHEICFVPEAIVYEEMHGERNRFSSVFRRHRRRWGVHHKILRPYRSGPSYTKQVLLRLCREIFLALGDVTRGLILLLVNTKKARLAIGSAGMRMAVVLGTIDYYCKINTHEYGYFEK